MPLFTYLCAECGVETELLVGSAATRPACPSCGGKNMTRMASAFAPQSANAAGDAAPRCHSCP